MLQHSLWGCQLLLMVLGFYRMADSPAVEPLDSPCMCRGCRHAVIGIGVLGMLECRMAAKSPLQAL